MLNSENSLPLSWLANQIHRDVCASNQRNHTVHHVPSRGPLCYHLSSFLQATARRTWLVLSCMMGTLSGRAGRTAEHHLHGVPWFLLEHKFIIIIHMYFTTYTPPTLITSPTVILNSSNNLFCSLDTALVLTSDDFHSIFIQFSLHPLHSSLLIVLHSPCEYSKLSHDAIFTMCSHTFILFWSRKTSVTVKTYQLSYHMFICAFHLEISSFFSSVSVSSFFTYCCAIPTSVLSLFVWY